MGFVRSTLALLAGVAVGGSLLLAYRVSQETGKSLPEAFSDVPEEAKRLFEDLRVRATDSVNTGRAAYREKQVEIEGRLSGGSRPE